MPTIANGPCDVAIHPNNGHLLTHFLLFCSVGCYVSSHNRIHLNTIFKERILQDPTEGYPKSESFANRRMQAMNGQRWGERRSPSLWKDLWPRLTSDPQDRRLMFVLGSYMCFVCVACVRACAHRLQGSGCGRCRQGPHSLADKIDRLMSETWLISSSQVWKRTVGAVIRSRKLLRWLSISYFCYQTKQRCL